MFNKARSILKEQNVYFSKLQFTLNDKIDAQFPLTKSAVHTLRWYVKTEFYLQKDASHATGILGVFKSAIHTLRRCVRGACLACHWLGARRQAARAHPPGSYRCVPLYSIQANPLWKPGTWAPQTDLWK